jgi:hypothetical protein
MVDNAGDRPHPRQPAVGRRWRRLTPEVSLPQGPRSAGIPYPEVERIPLADAKARYDSGTALFLDVRIIESYERAHIPNAVSMPLALLATRHQQLAGAEEILTYCT